MELFNKTILLSHLLGLSILLAGCGGPSVPGDSTVMEWLEFEIGLGFIQTSDLRLKEIEGTIREDGKEVPELEVEGEIEAVLKSDIYVNKITWEYYYAKLATPEDRALFDEYAEVFHRIAKRGLTKKEFNALHKFSPDPIKKNERYMPLNGEPEFKPGLFPFRSNLYEKVLEKGTSKEVEFEIEAKWDHEAGDWSIDEVDVYGNKWDSISLYGDKWGRYNHSGRYFTTGALIDSPEARKIIEKEHDRMRKVIEFYHEISAD